MGGAVHDQPDGDAERDAVRAAKVAVRLGEAFLTPMAKQLQRSPPGHRGAFLLCASAQFRRVPDSLSVKIDFESIKE